MADAGFFKGTSAEQDSRFANKQKKLLKQMKFPDNINTKIDMSKIKLEVLKPWITKRLQELLGIEDDVVIEFVFNQLDEKHPDPKLIQINLTGFLGGNKARIFISELWQMLASAQSSNDGIPAELVEMKKKELLRRQEEDERLREIRKREEDSYRQDIRPDVDKLDSKMNGRNLIPPASNKTRHEDENALSYKSRINHDNDDRNRLNSSSNINSHRLRNSRSPVRKASKQKDKKLNRSVSKSSESEQDHHQRRQDKTKHDSRMKSYRDDRHRPRSKSPMEKRLQQSVTSTVKLLAKALEKSQMNKKQRSSSSVSPPSTNSRQRNMKSSQNVSEMKCANDSSSMVKKKRNKSKRNRSKSTESPSDSRSNSNSSSRSQSVKKTQHKKKTKRTKRSSSSRSPSASPDRKKKSSKKKSDHKSRKHSKETRKETKSQSSNNNNKRRSHRDSAEKRQVQPSDQLESSNKSKVESENSTMKPKQNNSVKLSSPKRPRLESKIKVQTPPPSTKSSTYDKKQEKDSIGQSSVSVKSHRLERIVVLDKPQTEGISSVSARVSIITEGNSNDESQKMNHETSEDENEIDLRERLLREKAIKSMRRRQLTTATINANSDRIVYEA